MRGKLALKSNTHIVAAAVLTLILIAGCEPPDPGNPGGETISTVAISSAVFVGDLIQINFTDGVYAAGGGALTSASLALENPGGRTITDVSHTPGDSVAIVTMSADLTVADAIGAQAGAIKDSHDDSVSTDTVALTVAVCPIGETVFSFNEAAFSTTAADDQGVLTGTVVNPAVTLPGDGSYHGARDGDSVDNTTIIFDSALSCLDATRRFTSEVVFKTDDVDLDYDGPGFDAPLEGYTGGDQVTDIEGNFYTEGTWLRVVERQNIWKATVMRANYGLDNVDERAGRARIQVKYRADDAIRHTCPHPSYPDDTYVGNDVAMHQVNTDIDVYPIRSYHWYRMRIVFNSDKSGISGSNGNPLDIFVDDLGTDGVDTDEVWSGFINIAMPDITDSSSCKWGALPGDYIQSLEGATYIGSPPNQNDLFMWEGLIDSMSWKSGADYTGVDDGPN